MPQTLPPDIPVAYKLSWRPSDCCYCRAEHFTNETHKESAQYWGLFEKPQPGCSDVPDVLFGRYFIQAKYNHGSIVKEGFIPLYLGPILNQPKMGFESAMLFPEMAEEQLKQLHPHLFADM